MNRKFVFMLSVVFLAPVLCCEQSFARKNLERARFDYKVVRAKAPRPRAAFIFMIDNRSRYPRGVSCEVLLETVEKESGTVKTRTIELKPNLYPHGGEVRYFGNPNERFVHVTSITVGQTHSAKSQAEEEERSKQKSDDREVIW